MDDQPTNGHDDQPGGGGYVQQLPALLLRPAQAAQVLAISERTLWTLTDTGEIPAVYVGGKTKRYRLCDLEQWVLQRQAGKPAPDRA